jgi:hypothetical protein
VSPITSDTVAMGSEFKGITPLDSPIKEELDVLVEDQETQGANVGFTDDYYDGSSCSSQDEVAGQLLLGPEAGPIDMEQEEAAEAEYSKYSALIMADLAKSMAALDMSSCLMNQALFNINESLKGISAQLQHQRADIHLIPLKVVEGMKEMYKTSPRSSKAACSPSP